MSPEEVSKLKAGDWIHWNDSNDRGGTPVDAQIKSINAAIFTLGEPYDRYSTFMLTRDYMSLGRHPENIRNLACTELPCKTCKRMNDVGANTCWLCGNKPHV